MEVQSQVEYRKMAECNRGTNNSCRSNFSLAEQKNISKAELKINRGMNNSFLFEKNNILKFGSEIYGPRKSCFRSHSQLKITTQGPK